MKSLRRVAVVLVSIGFAFSPSSAAAADPEAGIKNLLAGLKKDHGLEFSTISEGRRNIELAVPYAKDRTHSIYLFAPPAAVIFGQRYITLYGYAAPSKGTELLKSMNQVNASTVLGTWFVGQNNLLTYKIVVPDSISPADFNNLIMLVAAAADAKEKELTGKDDY